MGNFVTIAPTSQSKEELNRGFTKMLLELSKEHDGSKEQKIMTNSYEEQILKEILEKKASESRRLFQIRYLFQKM